MRREKEKKTDDAESVGRAAINSIGTCASCVAARRVCFVEHEAREMKKIYEAMGPRGSPFHSTGTCVGHHPFSGFIF
jgi:hypothetical protein